MSRPNRHRGEVMVESAEAVVLECEARMRHAAHRVERALWAQSELNPDDRNGELVDFLLDQRATLRPSAPGSEVLREAPGVQHRYAVPVIPGRAT